MWKNFSLLFLLPSLLAAQSTMNSPLVLWPDGAPGALGKEDKDIPTLTVYPAKSANASGAAMVICPGGGYGGLAPHEGEVYAQWLADHGIAGFVLKYRLGSHGYRHPAMLQDVSRAIRLVRARAAEWKLDAQKVGVMGSSAGGHLASTALTHFDSGKPDAEDPIEKQSSRPNLGILCYPVISMGTNTHAGSRMNLLGKEPSAELIQLLSNELQVSSNTPPCFLWHTYEDRGVKIENSMEFAAALNRANVPFELHIFQKGGHGLGLGTKIYPSPALHPWTTNCLQWLTTQGFVSAKP